MVADWNTSHPSIVNIQDNNVFKLYLRQHDHDDHQYQSIVLFNHVHTQFNLNTPQGVLSGILSNSDSMKKFLF